MARLSRALLAAAAVAANVSAQQQQQAQEQLPEGLHGLMVAAGKEYFGTATDVNNIEDEDYQSILQYQGEFGMVTPENSQKWEFTQPRRDEFVYTNADKVVGRAEEIGQLVRCHALTWHSQLPMFVSTTQWNASTLASFLTTHIDNVVTHFAGQCYAWDVVNEALNEDGSYRNSTFYQYLGEEYITLSFEAAAKADPAAKLYYNDFNLETSPKKAAGAERIVRLVQEAGARIDGVGFQAHLVVGQTPPRKNLTALLSRFASLGVEVAYTELDIAHEFPKNSSNRIPDAAALEQQAEDYVAVVGSCLDEPKCVGVTVWQFTDEYSWVPDAFEGRDQACLWTRDYKKKPAYDAVSKLLREAAANNTGVNTNSTEDILEPIPSNGAAAAAAAAGGWVGRVALGAALVVGMALL